MKAPRIYSNLLQGVAEALERIFLEQQPADKVVERSLRSDARWGSRDRRWVAEEIYGVVRNYGALCYLLNIEKATELSHCFALVGANQWLRTGGIPLQEHWKQEWVAEFESRWALLSEEERLRLAYPAWLYDLAKEQIGEATWLPLSAALQTTAPLILRVNRLKTTVEKAQLALQKLEIATQTVANCPDALRVDERLRLAEIEPYKKGWIEIQDIGSQLIAQALIPYLGSIVVDGCAGAGGKSLHLAALMRNKGQLYAFDTQDAKLQECRRRADRAGISILKTQNAEKDGILALFELREKVDCLLLDAPCSGLGTLRRSPHIVWQISPERIEEIRAQQAEILQNYSRLVRSGGVLAYATCSILPAENEQQVAAFLSSEAGAGFSLMSEQHFYPHTHNSDGFYLALLRKG